MNKTIPLVSVVIPTYNRVSSIGSAINSALDQTYPNVEVIVVDDGSTDSTEKFLKSNYPTIKYIYQPNQGVSVARNNAMSAANGDFIAFLDSDDLWLPEKLCLQMRWFASDENLVIVSCSRIKKDEHGNACPTRSAGNSHSTVISFNKLLAGKQPHTSSSVIRKSILQKSGLFNTNLKTGEDWDLWLRIAVNSPIRHLKDSLVIVQLSPNSLSLNRPEIYCNNIKVMQHWNPRYNHGSPVNMLYFGLLVRMRFMGATSSLTKRGLKIEAEQLWAKARLAFHFGLIDNILLKLVSKTKRSS